jgi:tetratricopeptide (TPR) repeat protein
MKTIRLSILLAAGAALVGAANAQDASNYIPSTPFTASEQVRSDPGQSWDSDRWRGPDVWPNVPGAPRGNPIPMGVAALEANDFALAEEIFTDVLRYNRNNAAVRFYLGVAKMNLGKWDEAKRYLKIAARELRKLPDPKGHLGVAYAKLGDTAAANAQRARLVKMAEACKSACELSPYIQDGIRMIDEALAETAAPKPTA